MKPLMVSSASAAATDDQLVEAARDGSDEAFELLFRRYRDRISAHVRGMVFDHGRAEDIVQETFISALRSLRATDQSIQFKPWIHQIARNASIDHLRRIKRAEEISIDSDDFSPTFERRVSESTPRTDVTVLQRQDLDDLRQAFGGLPASQHEILVLRELEGLSYQEIAARMDLTPSAVESMLARARRSLKGHFDEIATGERCRRMQPIMAATSRGLAGKRDRRSLERHVRHCRPCRHEALALGLDSVVTDSRRDGALRRAAALLPLPWIFRRREAEGGDVSSAASSNGVPHLSALQSVSAVGADQTASAVQKAIAVVAVAVAAGGGGVVAHKAGVDLMPGLGSSNSKAAATADESAVAGPLGADKLARLITGDARPPTPAVNAALGAGGIPPAAGALLPADGSPAAAAPGLAPGDASPAPGAGSPSDGPAGPGGPTAPATGSPGDSPAVTVPGVTVPGRGRDKPTSSGGGTGGDSASPAGGYELPPAWQRKVDQGIPLPPGLQKKVDDAAIPPVVTPDPVPGPTDKAKKKTTSTLDAALPGG